MRLFLALLCCRSCCCSSFFFSSIECHMCRSRKKEKKYISATNYHLIATEQLLNTLALQYARVLIKRISFVVLVVVTEERAEALNYYSTQITHKIAGAERRFRGEKSVSLNLINYTRGKRNRTPPRKNSRDILTQKCPSSTTA